MSDLRACANLDSQGVDFASHLIGESDREENLYVS